MVEPSVRRRERLTAGVFWLPVLAIAALSACAAENPRGNVPMPPETRRDALVEMLHGVAVDDPYRWLEDQQAPETRDWIDAQNGYTDTVLASLPGRDALTALAGTVLEVDAVGMPNERGGRYFHTRRQADQDLAVLYVREGPHDQRQLPGHLS